MDEFDLETKAGMAQACNWQEQLCKMLGDGGKWGVPRSNSIYTVYPTEKYVMKEDEGEDTIDQVFWAMGWSVLTRQKA